MIKPYGGHSMVEPLRRVLVRRPTEAFAVTDIIKWHYTAPPDLEAARKEHDDLVDILEDHGVEVIHHDVPLPEHADSIFVHDPVLITNAGAIILRMGKKLRAGEETAIEETLKAHDIPIHYRLHGEALAEGGDLLWLDEKTLAVGLGFRTNRIGYEQLGEATDSLGIKLIPVELPYGSGADACLHLQSLISLVDEDLAVVYLPYMPVSFWRELKLRGFRMVEVPEEEFPTLGPNVLALRPRLCLMLDANPITRQRLIDAGCDVLTYRGNEISLKAEGGATCLTRPILRM